MTAKDPSKSVRCRPWVRYEREHSFSAVHMDKYLCSDSVTWVCAVLYDASRMILSGGAFSAATAENSINLLRESYEEYQAHISHTGSYHGREYAEYSSPYRTSRMNAQNFLVNPIYSHRIVFHSLGEASADEWKDETLVSDICDESSEIRGF